MPIIRNFIKNDKGDAVVEAVILFPIMIMIFAALVMLSIYLPVRATLQHATQYAATAIATEKSDTWLFFDESSMTYRWESNKDNLENVYVTLINSVIPGSDDADRAETIVQKAEQSGISITAGNLTVEYGLVNYVVYKEIVVTATRTIPVGIDLTFIGFPKEIPITVSSTAVVQNGDEFIRNMNIAVDFIEYIDDKYELNEVFGSVRELGDLFGSVLGWN